MLSDVMLALRSDAMVQVCMRSAEAVALLCSMFLMPDISLSQRQDILGVLDSTVNKLSNETVPEGLGTRSVTISSIRIRDSESSQTARERLYADNTQHSRHWWHSVKFGPGWVFFPLIRTWDSPYDYLDLFGEEHYLLCSLLVLLSNIIYKGYNTAGPTIGNRMVLSFVQVFQVCRRSKYARVRVSAWQSLCRTVTVLQSSSSVSRPRAVIDLGIHNSITSSSMHVQYVEEALGMELDTLMYLIQDAVQNDACDGVREAATAVASVMTKMINVM